MLISESIPAWLAPLARAMLVVPSTAVFWLARVALYLVPFCGGWLPGRLTPGWEGDARQERPNPLRRGRL